jgi:hypothetical protein
MLAEGHKSGCLITGNLNVRAAYTQGRVFEPTAEELQSFNSLQEQLCNKHGFGVMFFHLKPDFS